MGNADVHPCMGCGACRMSGNCVHHDDMMEIKKQILSADMLVFVTPIYYFGMSAQLKAVRDSGIPREEIFITSKLWLQD